jgi:hypothetical protein
MNTVSIPYRYRVDTVETWREAQAKIQKEANKKRSAAAKEQHSASNPRIGETKPVLVLEQIVPPPKKHKERDVRPNQSTTSGKGEFMPLEIGDRMPLSASKRRRGNAAGG